MPSYAHAGRTSLSLRPAAIGPNNPGITQKTKLRMLALPQDGYALNPSIYYLPYRYDSAALMAAGTVRTSNLMRHAAYAVPAYSVQEQINGPGAPIPAYGTVVQQLKLLQDTQILGFKFMEFNSATGVEKYPTGAVLQITDVCTGTTIAQDYTNSQIYSMRESDGAARGELTYRPLPMPYLVSGDGRVDVSITNIQTRTILVEPTLVYQLVIFVSEPCRLVQS